VVPHFHDEQILMAGMWSFEVTGGEEVKKGLTALLDNLKDLTPFWRDVWAPKYFAMVQDLFKTGGASRGPGGRFKGGNWAWLSPKYQVWKSKNYPGQPILVRDGDLRESLRWSGSSLGPGGVFDPKPSYVIAGTSIPYGKYHQYGTKHMPARPFLPTPDPAVFAPLLQQWLLKVNKP
jgi:phage gpG-like protein